MPKKYKWLIGFFAILLTLGLSTYLVLLNYGNQIIKDTILSSYNTNPDNPYQIEFDGIEVSIARHTLNISDIKITLKDSLVTLVRAGSDDVPNTNISVHINGIRIEGFDIIEAVQDRKLKADIFEIKKPHITIFEYPINQTQDTTTQDTVDLRSLFLAHLDTFSIHKMAIIEAYTQYFTVSATQDTQKVFGLDNLSYSMYNVIANKSTLYSEELISFSHYGLASKNISLNLPNVGSISVGEINYESLSKSVTISDMDFKPSKTPNQLFAQLKYRKPWIAFNFHHLEIFGFNLKTSLENRHLEIDKISIEKPVLEVGVDLAIPFHPNDVKPMLSEQIKQIPYPITVDTLKINTAKIAAKLKGANTGKFGYLTFYPMHVNANNLTNYAPSISSNSKCSITAQTKINGTGKVKAFIEMDLASAKGQTLFNVDGHNINLTNFNKVLSPIMRVSVTDGVIENLLVRSVLSSTTCKGFMDVHYENMYLLLENKDSQKKPNFFQHIASGLANGVLKNNNIPGSKNYHTGNFYFEKETQDSFFKLLWLAHLYGLEDSILGSNAKDKRKQRKSDKTKSGWFNFKK